ncbi:MAG: lipid IV(A) 3-deoxy-D-manno-octulosonic acid transferase [Zoogloeaceae bacterium]|nr:lipid IV(A) 3-deoxy-D-manno-octulosonic acid transferase [Zoogloeaceae bacterium]
MARMLYSLFLYLATPWIAMRLLWRARRQPKYLRHLRERWALWWTQPLSPRTEGGTLWLHAVSVGEMRAAQPLVAALRAWRPRADLLITCMTPTGRAVAETLYGTTAGVRIAYLPYDYPGATRRFLKHFRPCLGILLETEIWPNLMAATTCRHLPVVLANARLSRRSARGYARVAALARPAIRGLAAVAAQGEADANRLALLGAPRITVCGNLKFDVTPDPELLRLGENWRARLVPQQRPVWLAASTREGEEILLLDAFQRLRVPNALLVIVPRHPERFDAVTALAATREFSPQRRSRGMPNPEHRVWVGDSMGELAAYYRMADLAFVGGSLLPLGGQNLIEAAACGCPVLVGPHTFNFARASMDAIAAGAARRVYSVEDMATAAQRLLEDPSARRRMSGAGLAFAATYRGATERIMEVLRMATAIPDTGGSPR